MPLVASVGLPFLVVELATRDALRRCVPNLQGFRTVLPLDGAVSVYAYTGLYAGTAEISATSVCWTVTKTTGFGHVIYSMSES